MHWALEAEQRMLQEALQEQLEATAAPGAVRDRVDRGDGAALDVGLVDDGWAALGTAEDRGGQGGALLELALAAEQIGRAALPSSAWLATVLALPALDDEQAASAIEQGTRLALAVPADAPVGAGNLSLAGDALTGSVALVLGGAEAQRFVVPAGGELRLVEAADVEIVPTPLLDRTRSLATLRFDGAPSVPLTAAAEHVLTDAALRSAVLLAADALGAASRMLELAVAYARQRTQFGVPIGSFQAVKHAAAEMLVAEEASRSLLYYAAASVDAGLPDAALHAAAAKSQITAAAAGAAETALTLHGAIGYTWEHDLHLFYKRAKLDATLYGSPDVWSDRIANALKLETTA